jgi:hypothetical protein
MMYNEVFIIGFVLLYLLGQDLQNIIIGVQPNKTYPFHCCTNIFHVLILWEF